LKSVPRLVFSFLSPEKFPQDSQLIAGLNKEWDPMVLTKMILCATMFLTFTPQDDGNKQHLARVESDAVVVQPESQGEPSLGSDDAGNVSSAEPIQPELAETEIDGVKMLPIEAHIVSYTNEERVRRGLPPLEVDPQLMDMAREHCSWMTRNRSMVHSRRAVAENIAMGQPHSSEAVRSWMNSSGHRANILNSGHLHIGVGAYRAANGTIYWCQQFRR
jgi:hypothetical protein